ncbi:MAG TPA: helix-turn-helix domain-containing protein [Candidatus Thermoplasmatota archaeon]|nr:helix-turn-helix domain-containing protein [Candidatus Thermoplasmatota archaeon]
MRPQTPESGTQQRVLDLVRERPGISVQEVAKALALDHSTAEYHLHRLARAELLRAVRVGRVRAHYAAGAPLCPFLRAVAPGFDAEDRAALRLLTLAPWTAPELAAATGRPVPAARWLLEKARRASLVAQAGHGKYQVAPECGPCVLHLASGTVCNAWGQCAVSRSPRFSGCDDGPRGGLLPRPALPRAG